jgi:hypothetical protein
MTDPEAKPEYRIVRDGDKFVGIDSDEETVGVYNTEREGQADIARAKKRGRHLGTHQGVDAPFRSGRSWRNLTWIWRLR